ncbi:hypothetical protein IAU60_006570 [Kwoniella sp. DSM 27419]
MSVPSREQASGNWQTLQDLFEEPTRLSAQQDYTSRPRRISSGRNLRSLFIGLRTPDSEQGAGPVDILGPGHRPEPSPSIADRMTGSPSQLEPNMPHSRLPEPGRDDMHDPASEASEEFVQGAPLLADNDADAVKDTILPEDVFVKPVVQDGTQHVAWYRKIWPPSPVTIAIFKCSLSYLIASLFTFVPFLAELLSKQSEEDAHGRVTYKPSNQAHMVATIVVYFNPAKTMGNMLLSTRYCFVLAMAATLVSLAATGTIELFDHFSPSHGDSWDVISEAGDWVVCILWVGGTMGVLAWSKVWVGNPSYNSGCSMAAVIIYSVVIKEGALSGLLEVLVIVLSGVIITNVVCFAVYPSSATSRLQRSISKSLNSFSTLLDLLAATFLLERSAIKEKRVSIKDAIKSHSAGFKALQIDLREAKQERMLDVRMRGRKVLLYDAAIASLARLAQHLSSLRSSTRLQENLILAVREGKISFEDLALTESKKSRLSLSILGPDTLPGPSVQRNNDVETSVKLFNKLRRMAGKNMDALNTRCDEALEAVQTLSQDGRQPFIDLLAIRMNLACSLSDFSTACSRVIKRVYAGPIRERGIYLAESGLDPDSDSESDTDHVASSPSSADSLPKLDDGLNPDLDHKESLQDGPNETVFLVYFFFFTFEEFARELLFLLDTMHEIVTADRMSVWDQFRSIVLRKRKRKEKKTQYLYKQLQNVVPVDPSKLQPVPFPQKRRGSSGSVLVPEQRMLNRWGRAKQAFWHLGERLREPDMRYAIKTGLGGAILAAPAYTEAGRPFFLQYRGEWALIAYLAAMSQTVGQTNWLSLARVFGTIIGGSVAVLFFRMVPDNNVVLPILGFFFSIPCFYIITQMPDYTNAGRFILLTYNLSCLYTYNMRDLGNVTVEQIAVQRSSAVIIGVLWAAVVSRWWWPFTARRELRLGLSDFCLDLSYLYSRLVMTYSQGAEEDCAREDGSEEGEGDEESSPLLGGNREWQPHVSKSVKQFMAMELHLQNQLVSLRGLLAQTKNEPRLKGPFDFAFYSEVLLSCERMLDRLHSMRCVTTRSEWDHGMRQAFVIPVSRERKDMAGSTILYFFTLSAGFRTRTPLPPYLPQAERARQTLVDAIRGLEVVRRRSVRGGGRHLLFFAYATAMQEVIAELDYLGALMQEAYGVISQSTPEGFEALFHVPESSEYDEGEELAQA